MAEINPLRYRSYYYDTDTEFYYLQSRYYDANICRFINADSYASTGQGFLGYNMFAYCGNNPIVYAGYTGTLMEYVATGSEEGWETLNKICEEAAGTRVPIPEESRMFEAVKGVVIQVTVEENVGYVNTAVIDRKTSDTWTWVGAIATVVGMIASAGTSTFLTGLDYASTAAGVISTGVGIGGFLTSDDIDTAPSGYRKYTVTMTYFWIIPSKTSSDGWAYGNYRVKEYVYYYSPSHRTLYDGNKKTYLGYTMQPY